MTIVHVDLERNLKIVVERNNCYNLNKEEENIINNVLLFIFNKIDKLINISNI